MPVRSGEIQINVFQFLKFPFKIPLNNVKIIIYWNILN